MDSRRDVIKGEFTGGKVVAAVLATAGVAGINVAAIQFDRSYWAFVVAQKPNNSWHGNDKSGGSYEIVVITFKFVLELGNVRPRSPVVVAVGTVFYSNHFGGIFYQQAEGSTGIDNSDGGIEPVEYEYFRIERGHKRRHPGVLLKNRSLMDALPTHQCYLRKWVWANVQVQTA